MKIKLRRTSKPVSPSENKIPASSSPSLMGISAMLNLRFFGFAEAQMIRAHQAREQKHGGKLHANQVRTEQDYRNFLRFQGASAQARGATPHQIKDLYNKDAG